MYRLDEFMILPCIYFTLLSTQTNLILNSLATESTEFPLDNIADFPNTWKMQFTETVDRNTSDFNWSPMHF